MPRNFQYAFRSIFIVFLSVLYVGVAYSQGQTSTNAADTAKVVDVIEPVPIANIGPETESTLNLIKDIRSRIKPSIYEIELDSIIPIRLEAIEQQKKELDLEEVESMNYKQAESLKNDIIQSTSQLNNWRDDLAKKIEEINGMKAELAESKTKWTKTLDLERDEKLIKQVSERIKANISEIGQLTKELTDKINDLLSVQTELTEALLYLDEILNAISKKEDEYRSQLYTIDSPPIWQVFEVVPVDTLTTKQRISNILDDHKSDLVKFTANYQLNIYYHLLLFVVLLFFTFYLKIEVRKWSDEKKDTAIRHSLHVISMPFWSSLLVALMLTGLIYTDAPSNVLDYFIAAMVFPILIILPGLITSINKKYFYFVGAIFVITQFQDFFSNLVVLDRVLSFLIDLLTLVLLLNLQRERKRIVEADSSIRWGFAFFIMRLTIFLLSISLITNAIGNTRMARLISDGSLPLIYGGIIIYASAVILKSIFSLLLQHDSLLKLNIIKNYPDEVKYHIFRLIRWLAVIYWLYITLSGFKIYEPIYTWITEFLSKEWVVGSVSLSIGSILAFFLTLWISLTISKFIRFILEDEIFTHFEMPRGVPGAISMIVRLVLIVIGFILAFGAAKIDMSNITILFGALGVGIGFGLQNIFNNLVSGLILAFERPIQVGDTIQISSLNVMGEVKEIGIRASNVRTFDGAEVIVPNGNLISNEMINWTLSDHRRRQEIIVGVAYGTDTTKVLEILNEVVPQQENILKNPAPLIIFLGFGESSLDFRVLFWTHFSNGLGAKSAVGIAIDEAFKKNGIEIPFPQRDLHLRSVDDTVDFQKGGNVASVPKKKPTDRKSNAKNSEN